MSYSDSVQIASGQAASGTANSGDPVKIGLAYNSSPPTVASGDVVDAQSDANGNMLVKVQNGVGAGTAGAPSSQVLSMQGIAGMTPIQTVAGATTAGGASYSNAVAPATPALQAVKASAGNILGIVAFNDSSSPVFLKFYDTNSPTLGTTPCSFQYMIPGNAGGAGFALTLPGQRSCANKIQYAVTGAIGPTDNTSISANTVLVDVSYN
jgi:hypothetical protein